jgi:spore germination cell wall hydrolase CwlJ-like protein
MKTITKIALVANAAVVSSMIYMFAENHKVEQAQEQALVDISQGVAEQMLFVKETHCLATNIYHEARNEGVTGQRAVAWVTLNRVHSKKYPDTVCDVVYQAELDENGVPVRNRCHFSFYCDGKPDTIEDQTAWEIASDIAEEVMNSYYTETDPTNGAIMYHAHYVDPYWAPAYEKQARIDSHIFYK